MNRHSTLIGEMTMTNLAKTNASLPDDMVETLRRTREDSRTEFYAYLLALRIKRWPYRAIGDAFGVTRVAAKAWCDRATQNEDAVELSKQLDDVPSLPAQARGSQIRVKRLTPDVLLNDRTTIRELASQARNIRRWTPQDDPARHAARELEKILHYYATEKNVPVTTLAKHAGVTRRAIAQRLENYTKVS